MMFALYWLANMLVAYIGETVCVYLNNLEVKELTGTEQRVRRLPAVDIRILRSYRRYCLVIEKQELH